MIMVNLTHFRPEDEAAQIMAPLLALDPLQQIKKLVPWGNMTDSTDMLSGHGGMKTLHSCGMKEFDGKVFEKSLQLWERMQSEVSPSFLDYHPLCHLQNLHQFSTAPRTLY
jgi:hypothetical protein